MQITLGIRGMSSPMSLEVDLSADDLLAQVRGQLADGSAITLKGNDGSTVLVPARALGFIQINKEEQHRVGFGFV